ncbi:uncharacterized protein HMPREF1541_02979 [Cyphellophora europaea CBS 101466]|uniref:Gylcosyl hydrolase 115 C-terminal domain-containing protein n=1 Tax=Cyphellophora europaea (strain CBS 101466) TaxID=1220924 RepID=W2RXJ9_CYPE1|nr:uncharacterized protein HMPREF1541_02979 [Cyphellophora europaea CBS 101466]ETN41045.1 hypothetical protein HMPREF1541_02979 [Cyphellophora europaea CBS 101466]
MWLSILATVLWALLWPTAATIRFQQESGAYLLADSAIGPTIAVSSNDSRSVLRAAEDFATDFGKITGVNGTVQSLSGDVNLDSAGPVIIAGTVGLSEVIGSLVNDGRIDVSSIEGQWEAYSTQLVSNPFPGIDQAFVIAGSDRRGTIYGMYDISSQMGVSPWHWWADVPATARDTVFVSNGSRIRGPPAVKYRGIFINDEQPALTNWLNERTRQTVYGTDDYNHVFYSSVYELLLRLKANYMWATTWNSMFYVDDPQNADTADLYGIVMGTSHTEPMTRQTVEQRDILNGTWAWATNEANVTDFMGEGVERTRNYETLYTMGMRGLGDVESPTLNGSQLEDIVHVQQNLIREVYGLDNVSSIPQMWCMYKEVGGYFAEGMEVPDDVTILWADDNWANNQRLPLGNETGRAAGAGIYYHADYVGAPRDYKWIDTNSLPKYWSELTQAYERHARQIWILNAGDLKPMEIPITFFLDMAYAAPEMSMPDTVRTWLQQWSAAQFGEDIAHQTAVILTNYSMYASRRKYELVETNTYSDINYDEANAVLGQWLELAQAAQDAHATLPEDLQPAYFQLVLHKCLAGLIYHQVTLTASKNHLYGLQRRSSTNAMAMRTLDYFSDDAMLTQRYHTMLDGKWNHMMDQTHFGYDYWQQPMRDLAPPLSFVQQSQVSLAGNLGVSCEGTNGTVPGDDNYHDLSSNSLSLPPMDPYGPTGWIDVFSRGNVETNFNVVSDKHVNVTPSSGVLSGPDGNNTDIRLSVSIDWSLAPNGSSVTTINVTTTTPSGNYYDNETYPYGNYQKATVQLPVNNTAAPTSFHGHVESDAHISIEAEHFTNATSTPSVSYITIPSYGRTLSGVCITPWTAASQSPTLDAPQLIYPFYTFTPASMANLTLYLGPGMNTDPTRPLRYAVAIDDEDPKTIQPNPLLGLWPLPPMWEGMVADFAMTNTTTHNLTRVGEHALRVWLLEPGVVLQKVVLDLGGVRDSYLGPPESVVV